MSPELKSLAERVSAESGLDFTGTEGRDNDGKRWLELRPAGYSQGQTFALRIGVGWRRIDVHFRPDQFACDLVQAMGRADVTRRRVFCDVLGICSEEGAEFTLSVNGVVRGLEDDGLWASPWRSFDLVISRGMLAINDGDVNSDMRQIELWLLRAAAAVFALLPLEEADESSDEHTLNPLGQPEGGRALIETNKYERDRRNRAAALAIHGYRCKACGLDMAEHYGPDAAGLIEVHHITPVSKMVPGYIVNPKLDLVPLCPNCHAVAHRRTPPFSVDDLRGMLSIAEVLPTR